MGTKRMMEPYGYIEEQDYVSLRTQLNERLEDCKDASDDSSADIAALQTALDEEVKARGEADIQLQDDLQAEATTARAAEKANADAIDAVEAKVDAIEIPTALPNPNALTINYNGVEAFTYDGSKAETGNFIVNADTVPMSNGGDETIGAKINSIEDEIANKVGYVDISTAENPNRKSIVLSNHDTILGTTTSGGTVNIAMVSKWGKVDLGSAQAQMNLNTSNRVQVNDKEEVAYVSDVESAMTDTNQKLETINLVKKGELEYELQVGDRIAGTINLPKDQFLKSVAYNAENKTIDFVFETESGESQTSVDVSALVDTYANGNGLDLQGNVFSVKVDSSSEKYLSVGENGVKVSGIDAALELKADKDEIPTVLPNPNALTIKYNGVEAFTYDGSKAETGNFRVYADTVPMSSGGDETIGTKINGIEDEIANKVGYVDISTAENPNRKSIVLGNHDTILGTTTSGGTVNIAMVSKWDKVDLGSAQVQMNLNTVGRVQVNDDKEIAYVSDVEALKGQVEGITIPTALPNPNALTIKYNGVEAFTYDGSKAETGNFIVNADTVPMSADNDETIGAKINGIEDEMVDKVGYTDITTTENPNRKAIVLGNHDTLLGTTTSGGTVNIAMVSKWDKVDMGSAQAQMNLNTSGRVQVNDKEEVAYVSDVESAMTDTNQKFETVNLVKKGELEYELQVGDRIAGTINLPKDQFLKSVEYNAENKTIDFVFETESGESQTNVDVSSLVDTYVNGNGLDLQGNVFSVKVDPSSEAYLSVSENGVKMSGVDAALELKADKDEIPTVLPSPNALTIKYNGVEAFTYDGSKAETGNFRVYADTVPMSSGDATTIKGKLSEMDSALADEVEARGNADTQLQNDLQAEATTARAAEKANADAVAELSGKTVQFVYDQDNEKVITLDNAELINAKSNDGELENKVDVSGRTISLLQLNKWNVVDLGSPYTLANINVPDGVRPTVQEASQSGPEANQIAYVSDVENVEKQFDTIAIEKQSETQYSLKVGDGIKGTIDIPSIEDLKESYPVNLTNLLTATTSEEISAAIGGIDNLRATVSANKVIVGTINNGEVSVSIRNLGDVTSLYYILDTLAGYTVNEINITNTDGILSKEVKSHSMMTEEMVIDNVTTSESTLPLSANQGKVLNDKVENLGVYSLGNVGSFNNLPRMAAGDGVFNDPKNAVITFSIDNNVDKESGFIINEYTSGSTYQRLYRKGGIYERTISEVDSNTAFTALPVVGMYYKDVKVDTRKLFALTTSSSEEDIKAALQFHSSKVLPTADMLDDCLGKGYMLQSDWMPVSVTWNGAGYVFYVMGQTYMKQPTGLAMVTIKITDGVYSVFQNAKVTEFATVDDLRTMPIEVDFPIYGLKDSAYTESQIFEWFGVSGATELKGYIDHEGPMYVRYGATYQQMPHVYRMPVDYCAFESATQIKMVFNGLDVLTDNPVKYVIEMNLDGTLFEDTNSNVKMEMIPLVTSTELETKLAALDARIKALEANQNVSGATA